jgi:hypothetical protein
VGVVESAFGGFGLGGGVAAGGAALGHHHPRSPVGSTVGGSPAHRVAVGSHSCGNRCWLPG